MGRGISAICPAQAITLALHRVQAVDFWGHHCSVLARIATSRGIQLGFQVVLTILAVGLVERRNVEIVVAKERTRQVKPDTNSEVVRAKSSECR
jgi:hypothetical protein